MATTFQEIIDVVTARIPGVLPAIALEELKKVHALVLAAIPILRHNTESDKTVIDLANATRYYELPEEMLQVTAVYRYDGTDAFKLDPKVFKEMAGETDDTANFYYRATAAKTTISHYSLIGGTGTNNAKSIALNVAPTSVVSADKLHVYGTIRQAETSITTSTFMSGWLTTPFAYEDGLAWRCAIRYAPMLAMGYFQAFQASLDLERALIQTSVEELANSSLHNRNVRLEVPKD